MGLKVSIISNAARMTNTWIKDNCPYIDQVGISCDSLDDRVQKEIGRGFGNHVDITKRALTRINQFNEGRDQKVNVKLNTVVMRQNYKEDWSQFLLEHGVKRWKVFKILLIKGENDEFYKESSISDE